MAQVGSFGDIVFSVSRNKIHSFSNLSSQSSARYAQHDRHLHKPILEFLGTGIDSISFDMELSVWFGVNPEQEYQKLIHILEKGQAERLVIGGKIQGSYKWIIETLGKSGIVYGGKGEVKKMKLNITFKEYARR